MKHPVGKAKFLIALGTKTFSHINVINQNYETNPSLFTPIYLCHKASLLNSIAIEIYFEIHLFKAKKSQTKQS